MNNDRRKAIRSAIREIESVQAEIDVLAVDETQTGKEDTETRDKRIKGWQSRLEDAHGIVDSAKDEEQDYFDNMPESLQGGDRGTAAEEAVSEMETALEKLEELFSLEADDYDSFNEMWHGSCDEIVGSLETASS